MSSIIKDRSPYYRVCITAYLGQARRQLKKRTGTTDRKLAQRIADELEEAAQGRLTADGAKAFLATIKDKDLRAHRAAHKAFDDVLRKCFGTGLGTKTARGYITEWLERNHGTLAATTYARYRKMAERFFESLGGKADVDMAALRTEDVAQFRNDEAKRVSKSSANHALKVIRVFFAAAERDGVITRNVARLVRKERDIRQERKRRPFTLDELGRVLAHCDEEWRSLVLFGLYTGARLSDLAAMTWQAVDSVNGCINYVSRKTQRPISIPIASPLAAHIAKLPAGDDPKAPLHPRAFAIFQAQGRVGMLSRQFGEILADAGLVPARTHVSKEDQAKKALKQSGAAKKDRGDLPSESNVGDMKGRRSRPRAVSEVSFHALRHTAVSLLKNAGVSDAVARDIIGHESAAVSRVYTHIDHGAKRDALAKLPAVGGTEKPTKKE